MRKLIPHIDYGRWGGGTPDGANCQGFAISIEWLGLIIELCFGRVR